ncbi:hypothetical protein [Clostridium estertheticum]|uniref:Uncharacterized protein n=1 Tax=Clostridium estertheticum TaxID=238834 RepID=A0AA47EKV2_9CLOT|nr:hypothetical protein [Clostridium estertheticum]MBU3155166.1 hypothetical protein [Clostridium estertheticum]WAG61219.1 hypothetical protein LL038_02925 [Clostridium estertheticum]
MRYSANFDEVIKKAVTEAIKEFDVKQKEGSKTKIFHNTKLLLINYNSLSKHYKNAVDNLDYIDLDEEDENSCESIESNDKLFILSIRRSKFRTMIMVSHIKAALKSLQEECIEKNQLNKYEVIEMYYLQNVPFDKIAVELSCAEMTIRRWKNEMIQALGVYLFGVDAL